METPKHSLLTKLENLNCTEQAEHFHHKSYADCPFWYLQNLELFQSLPKEACFRLYQSSKQASYKRRQCIVLDDNVQWIHVVTHGSFKLIRVSPHGRKLIEGILEVGDVLGRFTQASNPQHHILETLENTTLTSIKSALFREVLHTHPNFSYELMTKVENKEVTLRNRVESLVFKSVEARLLETLLSMIKEVGQPCQHGFAVDLRLTQQDLADLVGASRENINRILRTLALDLFIIREGRHICVPNVERLQKLSEAQQF